MDCCRSPVWWIAHHNLRPSKAEAMSRDEYKGKDIDDLRKMCKKRRIEDVDQTIEFEALVRLHTTVSCFGCSHQIHRSIVYEILAPNLHHYVCTIDGATGNG